MKTKFYTTTYQEQKTCITTTACKITIKQVIHAHESGLHDYF